jgi:hypothetical protein
MLKLPDGSRVEVFGADSPINRHAPRWSRVAWSGSRGRSGPWSPGCFQRQAIADLRRLKNLLECNPSPGPTGETGDLSVESW